MRKVQPFHITSAKHETVRKSDRITKFKECIKLEPYYTCNVYNSVYTENQFLYMQEIGIRN